MFKGDAAKPETIRTRRYHQAYYLANKTNGRRRVQCPSCSGFMFEGREQCARCQFKFNRWDRCACGREKTKTAKRCRVCAGYVEEERRRGLAMAREANPYCPNKSLSAGDCETRQAHAHCSCGLPMAPNAQACVLCIAEQSRIEFKLWPTTKDAAA